MPRLANNLGAAATTDKFYVFNNSSSSSFFTVKLSGTFNTTTVTMQISPDASDWSTFAIKEGGVLTNQTFAAPETKNYQVTGFYFRFVTNSTGTPPEIDIDVAGDGVNF